MINYKIQTLGRAKILPRTGPTLAFSRLIWNSSVLAFWGLMRSYTGIHTCTYTRSKTFLHAHTHTPHTRKLWNTCRFACTLTSLHTHKHARNGMQEYTNVCNTQIHRKTQTSATHKCTRIHKSLHVIWDPEDDFCGDRHYDWLTEFFF